MADNCYGVEFTAYCPDGSEFTGDAGVYFAGLGMPLSGGDGPDQATIAGQGDCASLAAGHYENYTCNPLTIAPATDSQIVQKRRIPPLGPKATMRQATGVSEEEVGRTMAIYAYAGVFAGTLALYKYFDLFKKDTTKLLIGYGIVFAGLALGSAVGSYRVEQKKA